MWIVSSAGLELKLLQFTFLLEEQLGQFLFWLSIFACVSPDPRSKMWLTFPFNENFIANVIGGKWSWSISEWIIVNRCEIPTIYLQVDAKEMWRKVGHDCMHWTFEGGRKAFKWGEVRQEFRIDYANAIPRKKTPGLFSASKQWHFVSLPIWPHVTLLTYQALVPGPEKGILRKFNSTRNSSRSINQSMENGTCFYKVVVSFSINVEDDRSSKTSNSKWNYLQLTTYSISF